MKPAKILKDIISLNEKTICKILNKVSKEKIILSSRFHKTQTKKQCLIT